MVKITGREATFKEVELMVDPIGRAEKMIFIEEILQEEGLDDHAHPEWINLSSWFYECRPSDEKKITDEIKNKRVEEGWTYRTEEGWANLQHSSYLRREFHDKKYRLAYERREKDVIRKYKIGK